VLGILVTERIDLTWAAGSGRRWSWPPSEACLLAAGGDLRFYGLLQGWAIAFMPIILILFPAATRRIGLGPGAAVLRPRKVFEIRTPGLRLRQIVSGHTLKHLCAGVAAFFISRARRRAARTNSSDGTPARSA
jgi:hypothetical protein